MVKELIEMLPREMSSMGAYACWAFAGAGLMLWIVGARFNQALVALLAVTAGAVIGKQTPVWMGWNSDGMALAVGMGVVLGVAAFAMHKQVAAIGLGFVASILAFFGTWVLMHGQQGWAWPMVNEYTTLSGFIARTWELLPKDVRGNAPFVCLTAFAAGLLPALIRPRIGAAMLWSVAGISMMLLGVLMPLVAGAYLNAGNVQQIDPMLQVVVLACAVIAGTAIQWKLAPAALYAMPRALRREYADRLIVGTGMKKENGVTVYINREVTEKMRQLQQQGEQAKAQSQQSTQVEVKPAAQAA